MERRNPVTVLLTVLAYIIATFGVQGTSHFLINADHYSAITIMRAEPIIPMGLASMVIQGLIFAYMFPIFNRGSHPVRNALRFTWAIGAFLASYIALGEAGKYAVPSIGSWVAVELSTAAAQFTLFGLFLGVLHKRSVVPNAVIANV